MDAVWYDLLCLPLRSVESPLDDLSITSAGVNKVVVLSCFKGACPALQVAFQTQGQWMLLIPQREKEPIVYIVVVFVSVVRCIEVIRLLGEQRLLLRIAVEVLGFDGDGFGNGYIA